MTVLENQREQAAANDKLWGKKLPSRVRSLRTAKPEQRGAFLTTVAPSCMLRNPPCNLKDKAWDCALGIMLGGSLTLPSDPE